MTYDECDCCLSSPVCEIYKDAFEYKPCPHWLKGEK